MIVDPHPLLVSGASARSTAPWIVAAAGGALGLALALSPVAVVSMAALALLVWAACRGLSGAERNLVLAVLLAALVLRVALVLGLFAASEPGHLISFPFDGDGRYIKLRSLWIRNVWLGVPIGPLQFFKAFDLYGWTSYIYVIAYLQYLLGPAPYAIHLFSIACFLAAAILVHRLTRRAYGPLPALIALALTLLMPTLFMWSVAAMKESWYLALIVVVVVAVERAIRGPGVERRISAAALAIAAALVAEKTRTGALVIVAGGTAAACAAAFLTRRPYLFALVAILALPVGGVLLTRPAIAARVMERIQTSAVLHLGHVRTEGHAYKLLDERFYAGTSVMSLGSVKTMTWPEALRYALRASAAFLFVPLPWQTVSTSELLFVPQQIVWYVLLLLAVAGVVKGSQGDVFVTWLFLGTAIAAGAVIAPHEGNIGTLVRHRDAIVPFVACLAAYGACALWSGRLLHGGVSAEVAGGGGAPQLPLRPAMESSVFARAVRGSSVYPALSALFRPTLGGRHDPVAGGAAVIEGLTLARVRESGRLGSAACRAINRLQSAWRESSVAAMVAGLRQIDRAGRQRMLGLTLLVGALVAAVVVPFGDYGWPTVLVLAVIGLAGGASAIVSHQFTPDVHTAS